MQIGEPLRTIVVEPLELPVQRTAKNSRNLLPTGARTSGGASRK